jgi:uncharacterized OB-fold protein
MGIASNWRLRKQRYALVGEVCPACGNKIFPPRDVCPHCAEEARTPFQFSGRGEIFSHTTIYNPPAGFEEFVPYTVALIKLEEGPLVTAQITDIDPDAVEIGQKVEMVTRKIREDGPDGIITYGYKFRPVLSQAA